MNKKSDEEKEVKKNQGRGQCGKTRNQRDSIK